MKNQSFRLLPIGLTLGLMACSAACLERETAGPAYVEADGSVTWTILETGVRSDASDPEAARREEDEYAAAYASSHGPLAAALSAIGGTDVNARLLRARAPFEVYASARFQSLESLAMGYCSSQGWWCTSRMETAGRQTIWTWTLATADQGPEEGLSSLDEAVTKLKITLASGRFVSAAGFTLNGDREATIDPGDDAAGKEEVHLPPHLGITAGPVAPGRGGACLRRGFAFCVGHRAWYRRLEPCGMMAPD